MAGVDRAAFSVALVAELRRAGVPVGFSSVETLSATFTELAPETLSALYWTTRITLVKRQQDLATFDEVFGAVFDVAHLPVDPHARRHALSSPKTDDEVLSPLLNARSDLDEKGGIRWAGAPRSLERLEHNDVANTMPERLPSEIAGLADVPFPALDADDLALLEWWMRDALATWPTRRSRRVRPHHAGRRVALRLTLKRARRTGFEPIHVVRTREVQKPRNVVMLCDVSQSMESYATAYLHLMRAATLTLDAEVFAFATTLTRLTSALRHHSPEVAIEQATSIVIDRFGGTRIASNVRTLLRSRYGGRLRGAIVLIASDGWDSDPPEAMTAAMARLKRRAHRILWLNPRAAAPGFQPLVGSMAAALPYCTEFLPTDTLRDLAHVIAVMSTVD